MPENAIIVEHAGKPTNRADACVIWMHGLGADGNDFAPIVPQLGLPESHCVRFVFPNAPIQPVTINGGMTMPSWYDIVHMDLSQKREVDADGIKASCQRILSIAENEAASVGWHRLVIAGFSQGGAVAAQLLGYMRQRPAGLLCLSTYATGNITPACRFEGLPALVMHGVFDPVIPYRMGTELAQQLEQLGLDVTCTSYPMAHQVCPEQITAIGAWLSRTLKLGD